MGQNSIPTGRTHLKINKACAVYEVIDQEAILIHLAKGYYYNLDKVATTIWTLIAKDISWNDLLNTLSNEFGEETSSVERKITDFVQELHEEELILFQDSDSETSQPLEPVASSGHSNAILTKPVLEKFTDMKEFLLVDPIHEVDETGWPHKK